jgi:hypothetical protein
MRLHLLQGKSGLIRQTASVEEDNLLVFHHLLGFEIWLYKRGGLCCEVPYKRRTAVTSNNEFYLL